jgi:hypothetical protein
MAFLPASPVQLGQLALAIAVVPVIAVGLVIALQVGGLLAGMAVLSIWICGPLACVLSMVASSRWRRQRENGNVAFPVCGLIAGILGSLVCMAGVMLLAWPKC